MLLQNFSHPSDVMKHIMETHNPQFIAKLYQTCKYFPAKINLCIVDGLRHTFCHDVLTYGNETINVDAEDVDSYKNLWITESLISITNDARLSTWISNISRCTIHHLEIRARHLTMDEYEILTQAGTVEHIEINKVYYKNFTRVPLEVLLSRVPLATYIGIEYTHITPTTMKILFDSNRQHKISTFNLRNIDEMMDDEEYFQVMRKYAVKEAKFYVHFDDTVDAEYAKKFGTTIKFKNFISKDPNPKPHFAYNV